MDRTAQVFLRTGFAVAVLGTILFSRPAFSHAELTPIRVATADYPILLRSASMQGQVVVECRVDEQGTVVDATVASATVHEALQEAALQAARKWMFKGGGLTAQCTSYSLSFELKVSADAETRR